MKFRAYSAGRGLAAAFGSKFEASLPKASDTLDPTIAADVLKEKASVVNDKMMAALTLACEGVWLMNKIQLEMDRDPEFPSGRFPSALESIMEDFKPDDNMARLDMQEELQKIKLPKSGDPKEILTKIVAIKTKYSASTSAKIVEEDMQAIVLRCGKIEYATEMSATLTSVRERDGRAATASELVAAMHQKWRIAGGNHNGKKESIGDEAADGSETALLAQLVKQLTTGSKANKETAMSLLASHMGTASGKATAFKGKCYGCGKTGHRKEDCKSPKTGGGSNSGGGNSTGQKQKFKGKCNHCGQQGHKEEGCWKKHPELMPDKFKTGDKDAGAANIDVYVTSVAYEAAWESQMQRELQGMHVALQANDGDSIVDLFFDSYDEMYVLDDDSSVGSGVPMLFGPGEDDSTVSSDDEKSVESTDSTEELVDDNCMQCYACTDYGHAQGQCYLSSYRSSVEAEASVTEEARNNTFLAEFMQESLDTERLSEDSVGGASEFTLSSWTDTTCSISANSDTSSNATLATGINERQLVAFQEEKREAYQLVDRREYSLASSMQFNATLDLLKSPDIWIGDSGASNHSSMHEEGTKNQKECTTLTMGHSGGETKGEMEADLDVTHCNKFGEEVCDLTMTKVNIAKISNYQLFSLARLLRSG